MAEVGSLLGVGNPLLDISAHVDKAMLEKYGILDKENQAILAEEQHLPMYADLEENCEVSYLAGGATQNSIRIAQWIMKTPQASAYIGCTGKDKYSEKLRASAESQNVKVAYLEDETTPTGTCAVLVTGTNRTLVANLAACNNYKQEHLDTPEVKAIVEAAQVYYISGFFLTVSPPSALQIAEHACKSEKIFTMNLAAPFICQFFGEPLMQTSKYWDYIFGNETEAAAFAEAQKFGTTDLKEIALKIAALPKEGKNPRVVVITHGAEATIVATNGEVKEYPVNPIPAEEIVDTNGAGDAFVGGFLSQIVLKKSLEEAVRCGHWAASVIIRHDGATFPDQCTFE